MLLLLFGVISIVHSSPVRVCVPDSLAGPCALMARDLPETFACVIAPDMLNCLKKIRDGEADITNADPSALYLGGKFFNLRPLTTELVDGQPFRYQGIALVSKNSDIQSAGDLKGRSSCHTGLRRTVGWQIPVGKLLSKNVMKPDCEEGELGAVQKFFNGSCLPGKWSTDPILDSSLKAKYSSLCSRCKDPSKCAEDDSYAGYEGVMRCLAEGGGEVAFTKIPALREYLQKVPEFADQAEILCFEGGRRSVTDTEPCIWGYRPTNVFVGRSGNDEETERFISALLDTQTRYAIPHVPTPEWYHKSFLSHPKVSGLKRTDEQKKTYISYLGEFIHTIRKPRPGCEGETENQASFCLTSDEEVAKCEDYAKAVKARGLWPDVQCLKAASKVACMENLKEGHCDLLVLDGGDVYKGGRYYGLQPIAAELYNGSDATYYAVAVLRSESDVTKLSQLKDLRSCHTGMGRTAGWVMPVGSLLSKGLLQSDSGCNRAAAVADFFSAGSCVPGANDTKYNPGRIRSEDLCRHCVGDEEGQHKCARDSRERYSGYAGALRCLAEGRGDVSFIKHTTVLDYTDGHSDAQWTRDLLSSDFMLLCDHGGTAPVQNYLQCNLGKVPSHHVVTKGGLSETRRLHLARLLADSSRYFSEDSTLYKLFNRGQLPDLLFKDSATGLKITPMNDSYEQVLGRQFLEASRAADPKECA